VRGDTLGEALQQLGDLGVVGHRHILADPRGRPQAQLPRSISSIR
jgi:hypothetical protein